MKENNTRYTAKDIQVLGGIEAVRLRPSMYIGSTDRRGLHHLASELVDNSIDEAMAGFCDTIWVIIHEDNLVSVVDNGRGIPIGIHPDTGVSAVETVMTTLHAGGKFGGGSYRVSGGLHGVGASVVNALSSWACVVVRRDGKLYQQEYERGEPKEPLKQTGTADGNGTLISFRADDQIFTELDYSFEVLAQSFREMAYLNKGVQIWFMDERSGEEKTFYFEGGISSFVRHLTRGKTVLQPMPVYISKMVNGSSVEVALQYNDSFTESTLRADACAERLCPQAQAHQGERGQSLRRGCSGGFDGDHQCKDHRSPVRGPDQDAAGQPRGQEPGGVRIRRGAGLLPRGAPRRGAQGY
jgi:DNA gyrase subunit B